jgi:hypothetical protein
MIHLNCPELFDIKNQFQPRNRVLGSAGAHAPHRSAPQRRQMRDDVRRARDARWADVCERLERRLARPAV